MKARLGLTADLVEGDRGVFDVVANGELVFSKYTEQRFPDEGEIVELLRSRSLGE